MSRAQENRESRKADVFELKRLSVGSERRFWPAWSNWIRRRTKLSLLIQAEDMVSCCARIKRVYVRDRSSVEL